MTLRAAVSETGETPLGSAHRQLEKRALLRQRIGFCNCILLGIEVAKVR